MLVASFQHIAFVTRRKFQTLIRIVLYQWNYFSHPGIPNLCFELENPETLKTKSFHYLAIFISVPLLGATFCCTYILTCLQTPPHITLGYEAVLFLSRLIFDKSIYSQNLMQNHHFCQRTNATVLTCMN